MRPTTNLQAIQRRNALGFTLQEVVFSMSIAALAIAGLITGHSMASQRALWGAHSQAAQAMAIMRAEQTRAARWDPHAVPPVDDLIEANFPMEVSPLDLPVTSDSPPRGTTYTTITSISADPPMRLVRVECVWSCLGRGPFTNTIIQYRSPGS